jgi:hypothetical protein
MNMTKYGLALMLGVLLVACHQAPTPTPQIERPALERRTVTIEPVKTGQILSAPKDALLTRAGIPGVFVYRQGVARFQMVKTGRVVGVSVEILSGLNGGETLVAGDLKAVHDGSPVKPVK